MSYLTLLFEDHWYLAVILCGILLGIGLFKKIFGLIKLGLIVILIWIIYSAVNQQPIEAKIDFSNYPNLIISSVTQGEILNATKSD